MLLIFLLHLQEEMSLAGYCKHRESANAPPPLTREEEELKLLHESEVCFFML